MGISPDLVSSANMYARTIEMGASTAYAQLAQTAGLGLTYVAGLGSQFLEQANSYKKTTTEATQRILTGFLDLVIAQDATFGATERSSLRNFADGVQGMLKGTLTAANSAGFLLNYAVTSAVTHVLSPEEAKRRELAELEDKRKKEQIALDQEKFERQTAWVRGKSQFLAKDDTNLEKKGNIRYDFVG
jgi:hypothetical protein